MIMGRNHFILDLQFNLIHSFSKTVVVWETFTLENLHT